MSINKCYECCNACNVTTVTLEYNLNRSASQEMGGECTAHTPPGVKSDELLHHWAGMASPLISTLGALAFVL